MKFDIIGDIHGCYEELLTLIHKLGYELKHGLPVHPDKRTLALVGDLTDRGPQSVDVMRFVIHAYSHGAIRYVPGNHCFKLYRYLKGNPVKLLHGIETTVNEIKKLPTHEQNKLSHEFKQLFEKAPLYDVLIPDELIIAHAAMKEKDIGKSRINRCGPTYYLVPSQEKHGQMDGLFARTGQRNITENRGLCTAIHL